MGWKTNHDSIQFYLYDLYMIWWAWICDGYFDIKNGYGEREMKGVGWILKFGDWRNLFAFLTSLTLIDEHRASRPPKSNDTLSWKQEKNDPIWRANTPTYTIHLHIIFISLHAPTLTLHHLREKCKNIHIFTLFSSHL